MKATEETVQARRAALQLIDCDPENRSRGSGRPFIADTFPFILPEVKLILSQTVDYWDFECTAMGMTSWQRNEAWRLLHRCKDDPRFAALVGLMDRRQRLWHLMEYVFSQERRFVLAMMLEHYPAAGRKLLKSLQRQEGPLCRVRRKKQKTSN